MIAGVGETVNAGLSDIPSSRGISQMLPMWRRGQSGWGFWTGRIERPPPPITAPKSSFLRHGSLQ